MPIANTVEATIVFNFEDRFTGPSQKAFEQYRRYAESVFRSVCASGVAAFEKLKAAQREALIFGRGAGTPDISLWEKMLGIFGSVASIVGLAGISVKLFKENINSLFSIFRSSFSKVFRPLLQVLSRLPLVLPLIAAGFAALVPILAPAAILFVKAAAAASLLFLAWKAFEAIKKLLLEVKLKDEATARSNQIRKSLESTFRDPIIQEIQVLRRNLDSPLGPLSAARHPALDDGFISLQRNAPFLSPLFNPPRLNLEPQFGPDPRLFLELRTDPVPSFASGIRFVPRDMLAQIHKGETVLPKTQAEQFRSGGSGGDNITFQITGGVEPDQATARKFARMIEDERIRINERRSI
jgi:hypothetical protein